MVKRKKHILVADDDAIYRDIARDTLETAGFEIAIAEDGGQAIARLSSQAFDAAIIDLNMPVASGLDVISALRSGSLNATIPVIVITGHDDASAVEAAYRAGATSFLTKPLNWILFTPHVEFVLRCGDTERELREANATTAFLSDLKSQMMSALALEFQSPIKTIFGFSQLIEKEVYGPLSPPAYKDMMSDISRSAHALNAALLKVMDFGRTLTEHLQIEAEPINARDAVRDALAALSEQAGRRSITIVPNVTIGNECTVQADRALLNQALRALLDNAIRMSPRGGSVMLDASMSADGGLSVMVSDDGPPLPGGLLAEVNGARAHKKAVNHPQPSSDVSIKIAKILTEAHQGRLTLETSPSAGNIVRLAIPRARQEDRDEASAAKSDGPQSLQRISAELAQDLHLKSKLTANLRSAAFAGSREPNIQRSRS
ncbi:MAG: hybrid sensor histidine kinase/response regulator [Hyphomicrobium sp.]|nr:hybrid sensor histidine kinase/response regulator [Hyphomicrobium sp.]